MAKHIPLASEVHCGPQFPLTKIETLARWSGVDYIYLGLILAFAALLRCGFFTGFFGSDEVTYLSMASSISRGVWEAPEHYIGALRYGVNIPMALFINIFGTSEVIAGLWSLITSIGEVALVFISARVFSSRQVAVYASLCLACMPLHVHMAGRLMADAPLAFFVTASFVAIWFAEHKDSPFLFAIAGGAIGALFWIKEIVFFIALLVPFFYLLIGKRWGLRWILMLIVAITVVFANCFLMWKIYDDPLHIYRVMSNNAAVLQSFGGAIGVPQSSVDFYLKYLFVDLRHVWVVSYFALCTIFILWKRDRLLSEFKKPRGFIIIWFFCFLTVLSILVMRQTNYMLIFFAPLSLLAGYFIANVSVIWRGILCTSLVVGGVILSALAQQAVEAFTANSKSTVLFAQSHPAAQVYASTGATRADTYTNFISVAPRTHPPIGTLKQLGDLVSLNTEKDISVSAGKLTFAVMDPQMRSWNHTGNVDWAPILASNCLAKHSVLEPAPMGLGRYVTDSLLVAASLLPSSLSQRLTDKLHANLKPLPATVYSVSVPCRPTRLSISETDSVK